MVDHTGRVGAVVSAPPFSRISWGSIIAGTLCAFALQLLFNLIGLGIGLSAVDVSQGSEALADIGAGAGIWWGASAIVSLVIGGWIAGRLAGVPIRLTAALHGASVWALVTLLTVWLATTTLSTAVSGAFGAVGQIGQTTASAVTGAASTLESSVPMLVGQQDALTEAGQQRQSVMRSIRREARQLYRQVVSQSEQQRAAQAVQSTAADIVRTPGDIGQDLNALVDRLFAAGGVFSEEDRQQVVSLMQERLGLSPEEAEQIVQNWQERYQAAVAQVEETIETLRTEAAQTAREAAEAVGAAAGWTALALLLGLLAAVVGGMLGKPEHWMVEALDEETRRSA